MRVNLDNELMTKFESLINKEIKSFYERIDIVKHLILMPFRVNKIEAVFHRCSRSSHPEVFLGKGVLKIWSKFTGEDPSRSAISIKLQSNFIQIALRHGCSPINLLHISRTPFPKNTSGWLLLVFYRITIL